MSASESSTAERATADRGPVAAAVPGATSGEAQRSAGDWAERLQESPRLVAQRRHTAALFGAAAGGPGSCGVIQRMPVRSSADDTRAVRKKFLDFGDLDKPAISQLVTQVGSTNIVQAGLQQVALLFRNGMTTAPLATVFAATLQADVGRIFQRVGIGDIALLNRLAAAPAGLIADFFALPTPPAPNAGEISTWYGNYLTLGGAPGAYDANEYTNFAAAMTGPPRQYRDFTTQAWRDVTQAYERYVRHNLAANQTMNAFAAGLYANGQNVDWATGALAAAPGWQPGAANLATRQELTLIGNGLPRPVKAYNAAVHDALVVINGNTAAAAALVGVSDASMRSLIDLIGQAPHADLLVALDELRQAGVTPAYILGMGAPNAPAWERAMATSVRGSLHRAQVVGWINANAARLNLIRAELHGIDGGGAPNFNPLWAAVGQVLDGNPGQLGELLRRAHLVMQAQAHENDVNLPFGNRAGGLDGHFKKHVLGAGNADLGEPYEWLQHLGLQGTVTRAQLGALAVPEAAAIFGAPVALDGTPLTAGEWTNLVVEVQAGRLGGVANVLCAAHANAYHAAVSASYDNSAASYLYVAGNSVKINGYTAGPPRQGIFTVAGFEGGIFDFSSGYMPAIGAQAKWLQEHGTRLWDL